MMDKSELRTHFCTLRECLPAEEIAAASAALCRRLAHWLPGQLPNYPTTQLLTQPTTPPSILTYFAFRNEPDLSPLLDLLPEARWVAPRIEGKHLVLHPYDSHHLVRHRFGMLEPTADLPVIDPAEVDVALVPGVAFDRRGGRLGFGGGYYDRFLPTTPALRVGVAFGQCLVDELPRAEHDQKMDWIATPSRIIHSAPLWRTECKTS